MEKMRLTESYFECESHVLSGVQNFAKKFFAEQKEYSKNFDEKWSFDLLIIDFVCIRPYSLLYNLLHVYKIMNYMNIKNYPRIKTLNKVKNDNANFYI